MPDGGEPPDRAGDAVPPGPDLGGAPPPDAAREPAQEASAGPPNPDGAVPVDLVRDRGTAGASESTEALPAPDAETDPAAVLPPGGPDAGTSPPVVTDAADPPPPDVPAPSDVGFAPNPFRG